MRIIAGKARSIPLKTIAGMDTRPTTDRIKETLFNMIHTQLPQTVFLDLFAGSGGIGLEAISRGASKAVFVEQNRKAVACIQENIRATKFTEESTVLSMDVFQAIKRLEAEASVVFDFVFMDPPYDQLLEKQVLECLKDSALITEDTVFIVEASLRTDFSYLTSLGYELIKLKKYKTNVHAFIQKRI